MKTFEMTKSAPGLANAVGSVSRTYHAGEKVECDQPWKEGLGQVFVDEMGVAEWCEDDEAKDAGPAPENKAVQSAEENKANGDGRKAEHRGFGKWFVVGADGNDISGPHEKAELKGMGLLPD